MQVGPRMPDLCFWKLLDLECNSCDDSKMNTLCGVDAAYLLILMPGTVGTPAVYCVRVAALDLAKQRSWILMMTCWG